jgi:flagellar hook protein FlgE
MSLFGALFSGVSGLQSQSSAMGAIADNVTNVNTIGYKATQVNFKTLVTAQTSLTQYSPGGVQSSPRQGVDIQGLLQATTSTTDVGISGGGFFVTNGVADAGQNDLFTYTRAGSFKVDTAGFLQNVSGSYMQGWPLTFYDGSLSAKQVTVGNNTFMKAYTKDNGDKVIINDNVIDNNNLRPLNLQTIGGTASPTTTLSIGANLPESAAVNDQQRINALIFDSLGASHNISYNFTKVAANKWSATVEPPAEAAVVTQNSQKGEVYYAAGRIDFNDQAQLPMTGTITINHPSGTVTITLDPNAGSDDGVSNIDTTSRTVSQILDEVARLADVQFVALNGTAPTPPGNWCRRISGENGIVFDQASTTDMTFTATATDATGKQLISQSDPAGYTIPALDGSTTSDIATDPIIAWWDPTGLVDGSGVPSRGVPAIEFAGDGTPARYYGRLPSEAPDPKANLELIWTNGAENMQEGNTRSPAIQTFLGNYNTPDGVTQLSGDFQLTYLQQNGAKFGNFAGVSVGKDGIVTALFDNGVTRPIFMIPLASFTNPNGLTSLSGNAWIATDFSGNPTLREAGSAGAGEINSATLEASTVDLGTEFTRMITTQRAYSSAAKVITTADDMLNELLQIKR